MQPKTVVSAFRFALPERESAGVIHIARLIAGLEPPKTRSVRILSVKRTASADTLNAKASEARSALLNSGQVLPSKDICAVMRLYWPKETPPSIPVQSMVRCQVGFRSDQRFDEIRLGELVGQHGYSIDEVSCRLDRATQLLEYDLVMRCAHSDGIRGLAQGLLAEPAVASFRITPSRD